MNNQLFAIKDSENRFVDKFSIRYNKDEKQYKYISKSGWEFDNRTYNTDTGVILSKTREEAKATITILTSKLPKVGLIRTYTVEQVM